MNIGGIIIISITMKGSPHASRSKASDFLAVLAVLLYSTSILVTGLLNKRICIVSPATCQPTLPPASAYLISSDASQAHK